jgi:hypothetical protein
MNECLERHSMIPVLHIQRVDKQNNATEEHLFSQIYFQEILLHKG